MNEYPLYPELPEAGKQEAQRLVDKFKEQLKEQIEKAAEDALSDLYCNIVPHIESDSWTNYRNAMMDGFKDYNNRKVQGEYDFKKIRKAIYKDFKEELVADLNQDLLDEVEKLKESLEFERDLRYRRP
ncbi:MAG: hypothetical protein BA863_16510 [Desulfovibrio sp. S3730MH75]|nr:MAG: hypothetical protein BA863_16510 [Desulfovibrio sp. S3730MH75]